MAALYGAKYTAALITKPGSNVIPADQGGRVRVLYDTYDFTTTTVAIADTLTIGVSQLPIGSRVTAITVRSAASIGGADLSFAVGGITIGTTGAISTATDTAVTCAWTVTTSQTYLVATVATADADLSNIEVLVEYIVD